MIVVAKLRAALWTLRSIRIARTQLREDGAKPVRLPAPPKLPPEAVSGVHAVLYRRSDTCLVRASVRQAWEASQGSPRDLIIGVKGIDHAFAAHAWLDGDDTEKEIGYREIMRHPAPIT